MFANSTDDKIPALMLEFIYALLHLGFHVYNRSGCDPLSITPRPTSNVVKENVLNCSGLYCNFIGNQAAWERPIIDYKCLPTVPAILGGYVDLLVSKG